MTVYVDDMRHPARPSGYRGAGTPRWSHMFADTPAELLAAAAQLGLRASWIQHVGTHREHFDVTNTVRERAVRELGAQQITYPSGVADLVEARRAVCRCKALPDCRWAEVLAELTALWP